MAIFDFLKDAGRRLFRFGDAAATEQNERKLKEHLESLNLGIKNPQIKIDGDKVVIKGDAPSQEALEKAVLAAGNIQGVAKVDAQMNTAQASSQARFYTVKPGDTLSKIAKEAYGNANRYMEIFNANRPLLKDPDEIYPGQQLRIPQQETVAA
jgi:nucleoid-associated protein YgaU